MLPGLIKVNSIVKKWECLAAPQEGAASRPASRCSFLLLGLSRAAIAWYGRSSLAPGNHPESVTRE